MELQETWHLKLSLIFLGSGLGGILRYLLSGWVHRCFGGSFPAGTLVVNLTGCLLVGFLAASLSGRILIREEYRMALMVGLLGGFTTFSTFGLETFLLMNGGQYASAAMNIALSVGLGLTGVWLGYRLTERWAGV